MPWESICPLESKDLYPGVIGNKVRIRRRSQNITLLKAFVDEKIEGKMDIGTNAHQPALPPTQHKSKDPNMQT